MGEKEINKRFSEETLKKMIEVFDSSTKRNMDFNRIASEFYLDQFINENTGESCCAYCGRKYKNKYLHNATEIVEYARQRLSHKATLVKKQKKAIKICTACKDKIKNLKTLEIVILWIVNPVIGVIIGSLVQTDAPGWLIGISIGLGLSMMIKFFIGEGSRYNNIEF